MEDDILRDGSITTSHINTTNSRRHEERRSTTNRDRARMSCGEAESLYNQHYYYQHNSIDPIPSHPYQPTKLLFRALAYRPYPHRSKFHITDVTDHGCR
jgi:hypothetical protein